MSPVQVGFLTKLTLRNQVVERFVLFSAVLSSELFASQIPSLEVQDSALEIAAEANKGFFSCASYTLIILTHSSQNSDSLI